MFRFVALLHGFISFRSAIHNLTSRACFSAFCARSSVTLFFAHARVRTDTYIATQIVNASAMTLEKEALLLMFLWRRRRKRSILRAKTRRFWVSPIFRKRRQQGEFHNLLQEMRLCDTDSHFRMSKERFDCLLKLVSVLKYTFPKQFTRFHAE